MDKNIIDNVVFIGCVGAKDINTKTLKDLGIKTYIPYKGNSFFFRIFREIWYRCKLPFESLWYKKIKIGDQKTIIIFDSLIRENYLCWLRKRYPDKRIILYYVNPVASTIYPTDKVEALNY